MKKTKNPKLKGFTADRFMVKEISEDRETVKEE